jgi:hypothetical protein
MCLPSPGRAACDCLLQGELHVFAFSRKAACVCLVQETCIARNAARPPQQQVQEAVIRRMAALMEDPGNSRDSWQAGCSVTVSTQHATPQEIRLALLVQDAVLKDSTFVWESSSLAQYLGSTLLECQASHGTFCPGAHLGMVPI